MKFAYFGYPHAGGTYTVFSNLRNGLKTKGIEVELLNYSPDAGMYLTDPQWFDIREYYTPIITSSHNLNSQGKEFISFLEGSDYDGVFVNVLASTIEMNSIRYLKKKLIKIMIVHSTTHGTYRAARVLRDYVHATVCVSWRIKDDLVKYHGFDRDRTYAIPNSIDLTPYESSQPRVPSKFLRLLSLGRVEDASKGIFWLPQILEKVKHLPIELSVAGDGPDLGKLKQRFSKHNHKVNFLGYIAPNKVHEVFTQHDIFLFPSRFEGFGYTLLEAMAAGCVPVASRITGVTDRIISHDLTGFLFAIGNLDETARVIHKLEQDRPLLQRCSRECQLAVRQRFDIQSVSKQYFSVINSVLKQTPAIAASFPIEAWELPKEMKPRLSRLLPSSFQNTIRCWREKVCGA